MRPASFIHRYTAWLTTLLLVALIAGCAANDARDADLHIVSRANPQKMRVGGFDRGVYSLDGPSAITVLLTAGPQEKPERALIVRMFWRPKAAATPLDETATNATVQYIAFDAATESVGVYSGGGFIYPETSLGSQRLQANLWQATLTFADQSEGFEDTLGASVMQGRFTARRDDEGIVDAVRRVNIAVSEALGVPRFVRAD